MTDEFDAYVRARWTETKVHPAPPADDAEYLRRVTLDLVGRIPTLDEAHLFLADRAPDRRARLIDRLLASRDYAEHWADVYLELLVGRELNPPRAALRFREWLVAAFAEGKPYDRMVTELLTAEGDVSENSAGIFLVAHGARGGGPEGVAGATSRTLLGIQLQCAQCHDHPYDERYKQEDFHAIAAYFAKTRVRRQKADAMPGFVIVDTLRGRALMKRPNGEEVRVEPRFLGRAVTPAAGESQRQAFARAVVGSDLFAKSAVNRLCARFLGRGLVDPWDDLGGENDPNHPAILGRLAADFAEHGYDHRRLFRTIVLSEAYGRSSRGPEGPKDDPALPERVYARAPVRLLGAAPLFRSVLVATGLASPLEESQKFQRALRDYVFTFGDDEMAEVDRSGNVPQALLLLNGELTSRGTRAARKATLGTILEATKDPRQRVAQLFLATLTRPPTEAELAAMTRMLAARGDATEAYEDLFHALLVSTEFVTNH